MTQLAIKGHATRGKEVIEILEMLGGRNILNLGTNIKIEEDLLYTIRRDYHFGDIIEGVSYTEDTWILTDIEECLELYPFKLGDKIHIPEYESEVSICKAKWNPHPFCRHVEYLVYRNDEEVWYSAQELKECNADFLTNKKCSEADEHPNLYNDEKYQTVKVSQLDELNRKAKLYDELIDNACNMLYAMLTTQDINDYDYVTAPAYDNVDDFVEDFRKAIV